MFIQLVLEEMGYDVHNLGPCVPDELLIGECVRMRPDMIVISTVNGHGWMDGLRVIRQVRAEADLAHLPVVIGGKLGIHGGNDHGRAEVLVAAGFDVVFHDDGTVDAFRSRVQSLLGATTPAIGPVNESG